MGTKFVKVVKSAKRGKNLSKKLQRRIGLISISFIILIFTSAYLLWMHEKSGEGTFDDALWTIIFTLIGQGEFARTPNSLLGKVLVFLISIVGIAMLGVILSEILGRIMATKWKELIGMGKCNFTGHTILCGWNDRSALMLKELIANGKGVAVIAPEKPQGLPIDDNIFFIQGDPKDEKPLERASIHTASSAIIIAESSITDPSANVNDIDAKTILNAMIIENINRDVYTIIELLNPQNSKHARHAHVDYIINTNKVMAEIIASCASNSGIYSFLSDVLSSSDQGHSFSTKDVPHEFQNLQIKDLFAHERTLGNIPVSILTPPEKDKNAPHSQWNSTINPDENQIVALPMKIVCITKN